VGPIQTDPPRSWTRKAKTTIRTTRQSGNACHGNFLFARKRDRAYMIARAMIMAARPKKDGESQTVLQNGRTKIKATP